MGISSKTKQVCPTTFWLSVNVRLSFTASGNESYAIVEYAPHQKVPSEKRKQDSKNNTIEKGTLLYLGMEAMTNSWKDEDYISFIESLKAPTSDAVKIESLSQWIGYRQYLCLTLFYSCFYASPFSSQDYASPGGLEG